MTIHEQAKVARDLANELFKGPCDRREPAIVSDACFEKIRKYEGESVSPRRSFADVNPNKLCASCRAYWYAEMAAQTLERSAKLATEEKTP